MSNKEMITIVLVVTIASILVRLAIANTSLPKAVNETAAKLF
jgi:hypothetical protein